MNSNFGLVADYGSSSESENETKEENKQQKSNLKLTERKECVNYLESISQEVPVPLKKKKEIKNILANPLRNGGGGKALVEASSSVFYNPFRKDQEAKNSVLEKHVKLTTHPKDVSEINGKKICWNFRKGRCKFGHKCKYAHDSDLVGNYAIPDKISDLPTMSESLGSPVDGAVIESENPKKRKPGLSEGLIPNKRSQKSYKHIQTKEQPWLHKR